MSWIISFGIGPIISFNRIVLLRLILCRKVIRQKKPSSPGVSGCEPPLPLPGEGWGEQGLQGSQGGSWTGEGKAF